MKPAFKLIFIFALLAVLSCALLSSVASAQEQGDASAAAAAPDAAVGSESAGDVPPVTTISTESDDDDEDEDDEDDSADADSYLKTEEAASREEKLPFIFNSPDAQHYHLFPGKTDKKFTIGEVHDALFGFKNVGQQTFTIRAVRGLLFQPMDYSTPAYNFTALAYNTTIGHDEATTLLYRFRPGLELSEREWGMTIDVFFQNERNITYITNLFNQTVSLVEPEQRANPFETVATIGLLFVGVITALVFYYPRMSIQNKRKVDNLVATLGLSELTSKTLGIGAPSTATASSSAARTTSPASKSSASSGDEASPVSAGNKEDEWIPAHIKKQLKDAERRKQAEAKKRG